MVYFARSENIRKPMPFLIGDKDMELDKDV